MTIYFLLFAVIGLILVNFFVKSLILDCAVVVLSVYLIFNMPDSVWLDFACIALMIFGLIRGIEKGVKQVA